jgi:Xaa-Pro dipeptidase
MRRSWRRSVSISIDELRGRQARFAERLGAAGLRGALVVSRGGGTYDRHGDVRYLTGHYQPFVYLPENPPSWSGRSHTVFVIAADGRGVLCVSVPGEYGHGPLAAEDVRVGEDFIEVVIGAARDLGLDRGRVGLVGLDVLPGNLWDRLRAGSPATAFEGIDDELGALRRRKSPAEQEAIRAAAAVGRRGVSAYLDALAPGVTEAEAVAAAVGSVTRDGGGIYLVAASSGDATWSYTTQPLPGFGTRELVRGDLTRFDLVCVVDGYLSDFGRSATVGQPTDAQVRLLGALHGGLDAAIAAIRVGAAVTDVIAAGDAALRDAGVVLDPQEPGDLHAGYPPHWGHGLGMGWERPWFIESEDLVIEGDTYLAIERAVCLEGVGTASAEQTLLVHEDGIEVLTAGPNGTWT